MRIAWLAAFGCLVACATEPTDQSSPVTQDEHGHPDTSRVIFESARLCDPPYNILPALLVDGDNTAGVRFTTTRAFRIVGLGALVVSPSETTRELVMAVIPLDPATGLPKTLDLSDAIGFGHGPIPFIPPTPPTDTLPDSVFPTSFVLPPGTYGLVIGSNRLGVPWLEGDLPLDVTPVGTPSQFHYFSDGGVGSVGSWYDGAPPDVHPRMFVLAAGDDD